MTQEMLACGHAANSVLPDGTPACAICLPKPSATVVVAPPDLTGRVARCRECGGAGVRSRLDLPFFEHRPDGDRDSYYCGCRGWG